MSDDEPDEAFNARLKALYDTIPGLERASARVGLHLVSSSPMQSPEPGGGPLLVARFRAADLAWSEVVQGDGLGELDRTMTDIELQMAADDLRERRERFRNSMDHPGADDDGRRGDPDDGLGDDEL